MIELHQAAKERLVATLTEKLPLVEVHNGRYLTTTSRLHLVQADEALPRHGALRDRLNGYIDTDFPLMTFVYDALSNEILDREYDLNNEAKKANRHCRFWRCSGISKAFGR